MKNKTPKPFDLKQFITWTLRKASYRCRDRSEAMRRARVDRNQYKCAQCQKVFTSKEVQVDHKQSIVPTEGFTTWDDYINRMFCGADGLQILCRDCHHTKTQKENQERRDYERKRTAA